MRVYSYRISGEECVIRVPETYEDLEEFRTWFLAANERGPIALDTETTGLDIYSPGYRLRTVQFGDRCEAWVIHYERGGDFAAYARVALGRGHMFQIHNAPFDWLVLDEHGGMPLESLAPRTIDTRIKASLVDPRQPQEGGRGTGLKPNSAYYVDPSAPDTAGDLTAVFRSIGLTKETGWAGIPLDHPTYNLYAGLDVILTARLDPALTAEFGRLEVRPKLVQYEHELARICATMQRRGILLDRPYTLGLQSELTHEAQTYSAIAARYGVDNVNSTRQIAEALAGMGETLTERTKSGAVRVDSAVLLALADVDKKWNRVGERKPNPLADAVVRSKRAGKWKTSYADAFLATADTAGRIHPSINALQARTGRMSVTRPALQTLPSGDFMIRRALMAEPDHVFVSCDFQAIEMRVLAALADVRRMKEGFARGEDIHMFTARSALGTEPTAYDRKKFKAVGLGTIYAGGVDTLARQSGSTTDEVRRAQGAFRSLYPEIGRTSRRWQREAYETGMVHVSVTGRRLPLDRDRTYAVVNYACQSAARDVLGQSLLHMEDAGLLDYLRLPIHDEVLASVPASEATELAREIEKCMTFDLFGVPIVAEAEVGGRSWGSLYGAAV